MPNAVVGIHVTPTPTPLQPDGIASKSKCVLQEHVHIIRVLGADHNQHLHVHIISLSRQAYMYTCKLMPFARDGKNKNAI